MRIVLTGGVTGGHIYPAVAIGDKFRSEDPTNTVIYIASGHALEKQIIPEAGYDLYEVHSEPLSRKNILRMVKTVGSTIKGRLEALRIMKKFKPDVVVSTGSYVSVPVVLAAHNMGAAIYLHEQNGYPGISNRAMARFAKAVFLGFDSAAKYFANKDALVYSGNPVRTEFHGRSREEDRKALGIPKDDLVIMLFGGSQGSNTTNVVGENLAEKYETAPLVLATAPVNLPRPTADEMFEQIANDFVAAIRTMPAKYGYTTADDYVGRATKYAAEAMLARVWMFYTGFYKKADLAGISKSEIISYLKDVRDNSGFALEKDQREIWTYTNEYSSGFAYDADFGTYINRENLHWVGNHSKETIWGISFSLNSSSVGYNKYTENCSLRNSSSRPDDKIYPYGNGYSYCPVNPNMVKEWLEDPDYGEADKRLWGSVLAADDVVKLHPWMEGQPVELPNHVGDKSKEVERTLFHNKKYINTCCYSDGLKSSIYRNFFYAYSNMATSNNTDTSQRGTLIVMRFADVLL